jgi:hypothetical protein
MTSKNKDGQDGIFSNSYCGCDLTIGLTKEIVSELKYDIIKSIPAIKSSNVWIFYVVAVLLLLMLFK